MKSTKSARRLRIACLCATVVLAGCDLVHEYAATFTSEPATLVITPGYDVIVDSRSATLSGFDECPAHEIAGLRVIGPDPMAGSHECVRVLPAARTVRVRLATAAGARIEDWRVSRDAGRVWFLRPDGSRVVSHARMVSEGRGLPAS